MLHSLLNIEWLRTLRYPLLMFMAVLLTACGGGGGGGNPFSTAGAASGVAGTSSVVVAAPTLTLALSNAGVPTAVVTNNTTLTATVKNSGGVAVPNTVVTFGTNTALATITPNSASALTDVNGVATVTMTAVSTGAGTVSATAQVGAATASGSLGFATSVAGGVPPAITMTIPVFGVSSVPATIPALGNTSVSVTVNSNGLPITTAQTVAFTSNCASTGKAFLSPTAITVAGVAIASYRDNGCASTDTITASVVGGLATPVTANLIVTPPSVGSIQYVSATPLNITLRGMGGVGRQETSQVVFKVVDGGGLPIAGKTVNFALNTTLGGISLSTPSAITDAQGQVFVTVSSGTISTPVRVTATTAGAAGAILTTQSDQLTISTGIPDQQHFSLVPSTYNIEGWRINGATTTITARLADHFGNPVLDGTTVNFTCEGGCSITPTCSTVGGTCSATLTSLAGATSMPTNGRVTVTAFAVGEEGFTDYNGNGLADQPTELFDNNVRSTDLPEAWVDYNENSVRDVTEPYFDFNVDTLYNLQDGMYNGVLCNAALPVIAVPAVAATTACSSRKTLHVFKQLVIVMSDSAPTPALVLPANINLGGCVGGAVGVGGSTNIVFTDVNLNLLPAGTTITAATSNGTLISSPSYMVPNSIASNQIGLFRIESPTPAVLTPVPGIGAWNFSIASDAVITPPVAPAVVGTCNDPKINGMLTITVTTPGAGGIAGQATVYNIPVLN